MHSDSPTWEWVAQSFFLMVWGWMNISVKWECSGFFVFYPVTSEAGQVQVIDAPLLDAFKHLPSSEISNIFPEGFSVSLGMSTGHLGLAQKSKCTVGANELFRYMLGLYCCFLIAPCWITFRNIHWEKTQQQQLYLWYKIQIRDVKSWK